MQTNDGNEEVTDELIKEHIDENYELNGAMGALTIIGLLMLVCQIAILLYNGYMSDPVRLAMERENLRFQTQTLKQATNQDIS